MIKTRSNLKLVTFFFFFFFFLNYTSHFMSHCTYLITFFRSLLPGLGGGPLDAGPGTSRAFKHPGHDVTTSDVWPSILTDYTYDSELDNADGVPLAFRRSVSFPRGTRVTYVTWDVFGHAFSSFVFFFALTQH